MNPVAVLLLHQRQQRRSSASLSMWPAITGAMQAQEHRIQRWAVATRTRNPSQEALMSCFSQRITRIRRISLFTFILHSSFFIWRSAPSFFTSEDKNSSNSCNLKEQNDNPYITIIIFTWIAKGKGPNLRKRIKKRRNSQKILIKQSIKNTAFTFFSIVRSCSFFNISCI